MSRGNYPLIRPHGQPWSPTAPAIDHPLREIPSWVLAFGKRLVVGQMLTVQELAKLSAWKGAQKREREQFWPDDHATVKKPWVKVQ